MIDSLPDECLALIFNCLTTTNDRNNSSLVSHRWLRVEAETRTHLTLYAQSSPKPSFFTRFNSLTQLVLHSTHRTSINDNDIILITSMCPYLTRLKLRECKELTDSGMAVFSKNCKNLKKFSCVGCAFSYIGMAALLENSSQLEVLSVERLLGYPDVPANSIKLILGSKKLKRLKLGHSSGNFYRLMEMIRGADGNGCLVEAFWENVSVTDVGVSSLPKCRDLIVLISVVAENCKGLKKLMLNI